MKLSAIIGKSIHEHMSESTLERLWGYSTRHYNTVSIRTLNVLARFAGFHSWEEFCKNSEKEINESEFISEKSISASDLVPGTRLRIGWPPNRICIIRYEGEYKFIAEHSENATMQPGDTFTCVQFHKGRQLYMDNFCRCGSTEKQTYIAGTNTGLSLLEIL